MSKASVVLTNLCPPPFQQQQAAYPALMVSGIHKYLYVPWCCQCTYLGLTGLCMFLCPKCYVFHNRYCN